jgi:hypothetical protein
LAREEFRGIAAALAQQVARASVKAVTSKARSHRAYQEMLKPFDKMAQHRARANVNVIAVSAHNEAKLAAYREMGVHRVGVVPESSNVKRVNMRQVIDAFDPNQPRDPDGKWSGGGESNVLQAVNSGQSFYHGTARADLSFRKNGVAYFTLSKKCAHDYASMDAEIDAGKPVVVEVGLRSPKIAILPNMQMQDLHTPDNRALLASLRQRGYTAAVGRDNHTEIAVFDPNIIEMRGSQWARDALTLDKPKGGPGSRSSREETPSASTIGRIEKAQEEIEEAVGEEVGVLTAGDDLVCEECQDIADGGPYSLDEATIASYGAMHEMVSAVFGGPAIHLRTGAKSTTIGPNHPMLTRRGLVKARELREGDELLYDRRADGAAATSAGLPDFKKMPLVQDVFVALAAVSPRERVAASHLDLHGDAVFCESEVEVVHPTRQLLPVLDPCGVQKFCERALVWSNERLLLKAGLRAHTSLPERYLSAACRFVRRINLAAALFVGHAGPLEPLLFGRRAEFDAVPREQTGDGAATDAVGFGQREERVAVPVSGDDAAHGVGFDLSEGFLSGLPAASILSLSRAFAHPRVSGLDAVRHSPQHDAALEENRSDAV